jgi:hypothetical protein
MLLGVHVGHRAGQVNGTALVGGHGLSVTGSRCGHLIRHRAARALRAVDTLFLVILDVEHSWGHTPAAADDQAHDELQVAQVSPRGDNDPRSSPTN